MVGQDYPSALAARKAAGISGREEPAGDGKTISWSKGDEDVKLEFSLWPSDPNAPASAWEQGSTAKRHGDQRSSRPGGSASGTG